MGKSWANRTCETCLSLIGRTSSKMTKANYCRVDTLRR